MAFTLTFDANLARVRVMLDAESSESESSSSSSGEPSYATVERSKNEIRWEFVRGGRGVELAGGAFTRPLDDYEFHADVENFYRVRVYDDGDELLDEYTDSITPTLGGRIWLKSIIRPFLNRTITVTDWSEVTRRARNGLFDVVGRSLPVAVTDVRSGRQFTLEVMTETLADADEFDVILSSGDPIFLHMPPDAPVPGSSGHYAVIGDTAMERKATRSTKRFFSLPMTETAPPDPDVVGVTYTIQSLLNDHATWASVVATHATCADLLEQVGSIEDVIVS